MTFSTIAVLALEASVIAESRRINVVLTAQILPEELRQRCCRIEHRSKEELSTPHSHFFHSFGPTSRRIRRCWSVAGPSVHRPEGRRYGSGSRHEFQFRPQQPYRR